MKEALQNFPKGIGIWFFIFMIVSAIIIRVILSLFKALAHKKGETNAKAEKMLKLKIKVTLIGNILNNPF